MITAMIYFRSPLTKIAAEKTRDCLAMGLYENLFRQIMLHINSRFSSSSLPTYSIGILDIAGFGMSKIFSFIFK